MAINKISDDFIENLLNAEEYIETKEWEKCFMESKSSGWKYLVDKNSNEFNKIQSFLSTNDNITIKEIYRIQNPYLMASYLLKKEELIQEYGVNGVHSRLLLLGNTFDNIETLDFDLYSMYGKDIFFTVNLKYAITSGITNPSVLLCNVLSSHSNMGYFIDLKLNNTCYDNSVYPSYLIIFQTDNTKVYLNNFPLHIINIAQAKESIAWTKQINVATVNNYYKSVELDSTEAKTIETYMNCKHNFHKFYVDITKIDRIENPYLMAAFLLKKEEMIKEYGKHIVKSTMLLHGTKSCNLDNIVKNNFDRRISIRSLFGKGVYFTNDVSYAQHFSDHEFNNKVLVLSNVLIGNTCTGHQEMNVPTLNCDTSISLHKNKDKVFVKYDDDSFYPAYIIHFRFRWGARKV